MEVPDVGKRNEEDSAPHTASVVALTEVTLLSVHANHLLTLPPSVLDPIVRHAARYVPSPILVVPVCTPLVPAFNVGVRLVG